MKTKQLINKLDELFFSYGNSIQDCLKSKKCVRAKNQLIEFYSKYYRLINLFKLKTNKQEKKA
jgi:hypothetical protein